MATDDEERAIQRDYRRLRRLAFGNRIRAQRRAWWRRHRNQAKSYQRQWMEDNADKIKQYNKRAYSKYYAKHGDEIRARRQIRKNERWRTDPNYRLRGCLRSRINALVKGEDKSENTMKLLGCSLEDLWIYLESKFETGMTRENYGTAWEIDHIMPCAVFDLTKPEHQKRCFHFSNLQPLHEIKNLQKSSKIVTDQFQLL